MLCFAYEETENAEYQHHSDDPHCDCLTETDMVRFIDKPGLWFRKIQHSDTTITGKGKKKGKEFSTRTNGVAFVTAKCLTGPNASNVDTPTYQL